MVERYRRGKGKKKLLGSHQRCWIWGRNVVLETLRAGKWRPHEVLLADHLPPERREAAENLARHADVPYSIEPAETLQKKCRSSEHQGYLAKMPPFPYDDADSVLDKRPDEPLYAVLDSVQDPYNFGAMLRSAEVLGVDAIFLASREQVGVTSLVARTSAGAVNHVPLVRVDDLTVLVRELRHLGIAVVAASEKAGTELWQRDFRGPSALIVGNEGAGIREELLELCDQRVRIPQSGRVGSLNAAVTAGILFYEVHRQRAAPRGGNEA